MPKSASNRSDAPGTVDDFADASSPTKTRAPPFGGHAHQNVMPERIRRPIQSWRFAVPEPDDAVDRASLRRRRELAPLNGRRCKLFVDARLEDDAVPV